MNAKATIRNFLCRTRHPVVLTIQHIATIDLMLQSELRSAIEPEYRKMLLNLHETIRKQVMGNNSERAKR
jgi:hypothetical protein